MSNNEANKEKSGLSVNWLKDQYFTIETLQKANPKFVNITLRVRLQKEIEAKRVVVIGNKMGGKGRPQLVFSTMPVNKDIIEKAKEDGIVMVDDSKLVTILNVNSSTTPTKSTLSTQITSPVIQKGVIA